MIQRRTEDLAMPMITKFRIDNVLPTPYDVNPQTVLDGDPQHAAEVLWRSADGTMLAGYWRSTPGTFTVSSAGNESTLVTKGRIEVTAADGTTEKYAVGDVMTFELGTTSTFTVLEDYEDYYVVSNPEGLKL
jgi:uncharacterized cupin superfamily protein